MIEIAENRAEISFTFHYRLGERLRASRQASEIALDQLEARGWHHSELARYLRGDAMQQLLVDHFHIKPPRWTPSVVSDRPVGTGRNQHDFAAPLTFPTGDGKSVHDSLGAIECTLFQNGYLVVVVRVNNRTKIDARDLVDVIRHPEFVNDAKPGSTADLHPGRLVLAVCEHMVEIEDHVAAVVNLLELSELRMVDGRWKDLSPLRSGSGHGTLSERRMPPHVGVLFRLPEYEIADHDTRGSAGAPAIYREDLQRLVIALGRPTPSFVDTFENPGDYLAPGERDVYGAGGSIVYIGARAWCVFDAEQHNYDAFRLGVVEMTHFVIMAIQAAAFARQDFLDQVHEEGAACFQRLNASVTDMVGWRRHYPLAAASTFRRNIAAATSFLARARLVSPCEDMTSVLETRLKSHTARAAFRRIKVLTHYDELATSSREKMGNYSAFLETSSQYLQLRVLRYAQYAFVAAALGVAFGVAGLIWNLGV